MRTAGWRESSGLTTSEALARCVDASVSHVLCTAIARDGTRNGTDLELLRVVAGRAWLDGTLAL